MTNYEILSLVISLVALITAIVALFRTFQSTPLPQKSETSSAKTVNAAIDSPHAAPIAGSNAAIDVILQSLDDGYQFIISNIGASAATDINFSIEGETNPLIEKEYKKKIPIASLKPGKSIKLGADFSIGEPREYTTLVSWKNVDGSKDKNSFYVSA